MSKSVLISIQPEWCYRILSGEKTIEIRKNKPNLTTPFKCYIYCTLSGSNGFFKNTLNGDVAKWNRENWGLKKGKVLGEFICDEIIPIRVFENGSIQDYIFHKLNRSCVPYDDIANYIGNNKTGYGWHISDLIIYDEPKELSEFRRECDYEKNCGDCPHLYVENTPNCYETWCEVDGFIPLKRPPQSWCYTEGANGIH